MLLVTPHGNVTFMNHAARLELDGRHPLQLQAGTLAAQRPQDVTPLSDALTGVRDTLAAHGLDGAFSDLFEMRIGRVRTSTDYQNTVKFPALQRTIDAMPASDERQQLQYLLEAVGYPHLIALSSYNRLLDAAEPHPHLVIFLHIAIVDIRVTLTVIKRT